MDQLIGEREYWNRGTGLVYLKLMRAYLKEKRAENVDLLILTKITTGLFVPIKKQGKKLSENICNMKYLVVNEKLFGGFYLLRIPRKVFLNRTCGKITSKE